jgi:hypothetical protein
MPKLDIAKLNKIYDEAEQADKEQFAEFRSNILLIAGEHYNRKGAQRALNRLRASNHLTETQKLRITKNHMHKVVRHYCTNILTHAPGATVGPNQEQDMQDKKAAELNLAVWENAKFRYRMREKIREYVRDFVGVGEVCVKMYYNPNAGTVTGYRQAVDELGQPAIDEQGQPAADPDQPVFSGQFEFERVFAGNVLRQIGGRSMKESACWIIRKMVDVEELKAKYADDPTKAKLFSESRPEDFIVFDSDKAGYERVKGQTLVREFYWPPGSQEFPEGYFAYATQDGIFEEGPLPGGIWPIVWAGFDEHSTRCRAQSILKVARPYQAEINRASSAMAMHQITVGDDKILYQSGTKLQPGALLPGVRGLTYQGMAPQVLPGRDGGQYANYILATLSEMYAVLMMDEENQTKDTGQLDPYALLFRSMRQQKKFSEYGEKFEQFLMDFCETYLAMARFYFSDEELILAVGKRERINIAEFRGTSPLHYKIKLEPQDETWETKFGRQITLNHLVQYVGPNLGKDELGRLIKGMPFANAKDMLSDLTIDADLVENDMLSLERGAMPAFREADKHEYFVKRIDLRISQPDFVYLHPAIQQMYRAKKQMHEQMMSIQAEKLAAAKNEYIPTGGAMIATDMYVPNPKGPDAPAKRVRIPYQAVDWLVQRLETQGMGLDALEAQNKQTLTEVAGMLMQSRGGQAAPRLPQGQPPMMNPTGQSVGVS